MGKGDPTGPRGGTHRNRGSNIPTPRYQRHRVTHAGASVLELMLQGRWASEEMPRLYTDIAKKVRREFAAILSQI